MNQLPVFLSLAGRTVVLVGTGEAAEAKARLIARAGGRIASAWEPGAAIGFVALDDEGAARAGLAKAIRQRLEALLPERLGALASALHAARAAMTALWPAPADRRRAIDAALGEGGVLDPFDEASAERVEAWLASSAAADPADSAVPSRLEVIALASEDPEDLTLRAARLLGQADHVFHHPAVPCPVLARARADAVRIAARTPPTEPPPGLSLWLGEPGAPLPTLGA